MAGSRSGGLQAEFGRGAHLCLQGTRRAAVGSDEESVDEAMGRNISGEMGNASEPIEKNMATISRVLRSNRVDWTESIAHNRVRHWPRVGPLATVGAVGAAVGAGGVVVQLGT